MQWHYTLPLFAASASLLVIAFYAWRRRGTPGGAALASLMVAGAWWGFAYALSLSAADPPARFFWADLKYLGIVVVPTAWLAFALGYTGRGGWLTPRNLSLLAIEPLVTLLLIFTNEAHGLFWRSRHPIAIEPLSWGPWFYIHLAYSYLLVGAGTFFLIRALVFSSHLHRGQRVALLVGALVPWVGNAANVFGLIPARYPDPTPFTFILTGAAFLWALYRYGLLDVLPVARDAVVEGMRDGMIVLDERNRIVDLNPAARSVFERPASDVVGRDVAEIAPDLAARLERHRGAEGGQEQLALPGCAPRDYELTVSPLRQRSGEVTGRLILLRDVTERKRAEDALKESERRFRQLFEQSVDALLVHDEEGRLLDCNGEACRSLGYSREEMLSLSVKDFATNLASGEEQALKRVMLWQRAEATEIDKITAGWHLAQHRRKDGMAFPVEVRVGYVDFGGKRRMLASIRDITETKRAAEELLRSERELAEAQRIAHVGSWSFDVARDEAHWSEEMYRIFGYASQEVVVTYKRFLNLVHPHDRDLVQRATRKVLRERSEDVRSIDYRLVRPDGEVRSLHSEYEVVRDGSGRPLRLVGTSQDVTDRKALEEKLEHQAFHDPVTDLPNRALFMDRLEQAMARMRRRAGRSSVLFLDLDNFKFINDTLGHHAGDELLVAVADRLKGCLRPSDTAARFGGDEFAALLEDVGGVEGATRIAERMIGEMKTPFVLEGQEVYVTPSIGIALGDPNQDSPEDVLRRADVAMYRAKEEGKAHYRVFDPGMEGRIRERLRLENDLRRASERDEFEVHYQPVVATDTGCIIGMEALLRWGHPERGLVPSTEFVALAEEIGLIVPIGRMVLREACLRTREWQVRYPNSPSGPPLIVGVNLSARQLWQPGLVEDVEDALRESGLDPRYLVLEITESAMVEDEERHIGTLRALSDLGVRLALDDFGVGYSSLSYLKRLPVGMLKIDRSFVETIGEDAEDEALIEGVIGIAHSLRLRVLAEGVETPGQLELVKALGCELAQGNYFSEPLPAKAMDELLVSRTRAR